MVVDSMAGVKYSVLNLSSLLGPSFRSTFRPCESPGKTFDLDP